MVRTFDGRVALDQGPLQSMEQDVQRGRADCEGEEDRADVVAGDAAGEEVVGSCEVGDESEEKWSEKEESEREEVGEKCPRAPMSG